MEIPNKWIQQYVGSLLKGAEAFGPDTAMGASALLRVEAILDMVKAYMERNDVPLVK